MPMYNATDFGKVAVLYGGLSAEREGSLKSGKAVFDALRRKGVDAYAIDAGKDILQALAAGHYDRAFIVLHGRGGEDGVLQGALELLGLPYTGSRILGSALGMDKLRTKRVWLGAGLPTPEFVLLDADSDFAAAVKTLGLPLMRLETPRAFYDYEAKYLADSTRYYCPSGLEPQQEKRFQELALRAFET